MFSKLFSSPAYDAIRYQKLKSEDEHDLRPLQGSPFLTPRLRFRSSKQPFYLFLLLLFLIVVLLFFFKFNPILSTVYDVPIHRLLPRTLSNTSSWFEDPFNFLREAETDAPLNVPQKIVLTELETMQLADNQSNVAGVYWYRWKTAANEWPSQYTESSDVQNCPNVELTDPFQVQHHNLFWQIFERKFEDPAWVRLPIYLYNAYYDNRMKVGPVVRMISINTNQSIAEKLQWS